MKESFNKSNSSGIRRLLVLSAVSALLAVSFTGCFGGSKTEETVPSTEPPLMIATDPTTEATEAATAPTEAESNVTVDGKNVTITGAPVEVRTAPGADGKTMGKLEVGTQSEILRQIELDGINWALVREGWICLDNVDLDNAVIENESSSDDITVVPEEDKDDVPAETTRPSDNNQSQGTSVNKVGVVTARGLNVRSEPNTTSKVVDSLANGARVTVLEQKGDWGRTSKGWISLKYVRFDGTANNNTNNNNTANNTTPSGNVIAKGIVTTDNLNIRSGAGTDHNAVGSYSYGDRVEFYEKTTVGDMTWGKTSKGWISLGYVYMDGTRSNNASAARVTGDAVNVRSGPGTNYKVVGSVSSGDSIEVLAQFKYGNTTWGCLSNGWISMDFVELAR